MYLAFMASKGGVGKSALAKMFHQELTRQGHKVNGKDSDPQQHFRSYLNSQTEHDTPDVVLIDTQGAWTTDNKELVQLLSTENHKIIVPFKPGDDEVKEALVMAKRLKEMNALDNAVFVVNEAPRDFDPECREYADQLKEYGLNVSKWQFQDLKDMRKTQNKGKAQKQIQRFLHEQGI